MESTTEEIITPEEQKRRVDSGDGWLLCDVCDEPAVVHVTSSDEYLCQKHDRTPRLLLTSLA